MSHFAGSRTVAEPMPSARPPSGARAVALCLILAVLPGLALAHGGRLPLDDWGGYGGEVLRCQRVIARAAGQCAAGAWAARRACRQAELSGRTCDAAATDARIARVRAATLDRVDAACDELLSRSLQYLGTFDLQDDVISYCRAWEDAAESGVFRVAAGACTTALARATTEVMHAAMRGYRRAMDRLAASARASSRRPTLIAGAEQRLTRVTEGAAARLAARCPDFATYYGRPAADLIATLAARAACIGGAFYIQDTVLCPPPVCGNAVIEPTEECDDGNTTDGDQCPSSCSF